MWSRGIEIGCGVLCAALGVFALDRWLFGYPCLYFESCTGLTTWQLLGPASLWYPFTFFAGLSLAVAAGALWHGLGQHRSALAFVWVCTALLIATWGALGQWVAIGGFSDIVSTLQIIVQRFPELGIEVQPQWVVALALVAASELAFVASVAGTMSARQRVPARV